MDTDRISTKDRVEAMDLLIESCRTINKMQEHSHERARGAARYVADNVVCAMLQLGVTPTSIHSILHWGPVKHYPYTPQTALSGLLNACLLVTDAGVGDNFAELCVSALRNLGITPEQIEGHVREYA